METRLVKTICAILLFTALSSQANGQVVVYWSQQAGSEIVRRANFDGTNPETLLPFSVQAIALDISQGVMYLATPGLNGKISRANLDGSNRVDIQITKNTMGIALDLANGKLYWSDNNFADSIFTIMRSNLDGTSSEIFYATDVEIGDVDFDPTRSNVYWVENQNTVMRRNLTSKFSIEAFFQTNWTILGIAIDTQTQNVYWTRLQTPTQWHVMRFSLGAGHDQLVTGGFLPKYIAADPVVQKMY